MESYTVDRHEAIASDVWAAQHKDGASKDFLGILQYNTNMPGR